MTQCPKCQLILETSQDTCSICGSPTTFVEQGAAAEELTAELRQPEETPDPYATRQMETEGLWEPGAAAPVEQSADPDDNAGTKDTTPPTDVAAVPPPQAGGTSRWLYAALATACLLALVGAVAVGYVLGQRSKDATILQLAAENNRLNGQIGDQLVSQFAQCREEKEQVTARAVEFEVKNDRLTTDAKQSAAERKGLTTKVGDLTAKVGDLNAQLDARNSDYEELAVKYKDAMQENAALKRSRSTTGRQSAGNRNQKSSPPGGREKGRGRSRRAD
ncbi:MAG: hypothetical protein JOZ02_02670 [Acidobacteria bacterium]|nr:hypothetical protein [Acidobacteriota bacterium]